MTRKWNKPALTCHESHFRYGKRDIQKWFIVNERGIGLEIKISSCQKDKLMDNIGGRVKLIEFEWKVGSFVMAIFEKES